MPFRNILRLPLSDAFFFVRGFSLIQITIFRMLGNNADARKCSSFALALATCGLSVVTGNETANVLLRLAGYQPSP